MRTFDTANDPDMKRGATCQKQVIGRQGRYE